MRQNVPAIKLRRMSLVALIKGKSGASGFGYASTAEEVTAGLDLRGKVILITGANSGLGLESARVLASRGAQILVAARTVDKAAPVCESLGQGALPVTCELSEPTSVRSCVEHVKGLGLKLDVLLCNAGIMTLPERTVVLGQELQFLTNHIGHFMLVTGLLDQLTDNGRVVVLSSAAHRWAPAAGIQFEDLSFKSNYSPRGAYGQAKLANLLFARSLAKRLAGTGKTANSLHPGVINTNLGRHMSSVLRALAPIANAIALKTIPQGAATQCYVAVHPSLAKVSGEYFADCNLARSSSFGRDDAMADKLWDVSEKIIAGF